ncbi:helix-turn-helix transcriptional regulator [Halovulum sp. GXIMD14794]
MRLPAWALWGIVPVQLICTGFFIWDIGAALIGVRTAPISWQARELIEIGAALGLVLGFVIGLQALIVTRRRNRLVESQLRAASTAFAELLEERFEEWGLTPAERDVAWFTLKGFSNGEIANLRETSEGTVKAQSNAIFRKAGVSGRSQLMALFLDDLLTDGPLTKRNAPENAAEKT